MNIEPYIYLIKQVVYILIKRKRFPYNYEELVDIGTSYLWEQLKDKPDDLVINKHIMFLYVYNRLQLLAYNHFHIEYDISTDPESPIDDIMIRQMLLKLRPIDAYIIEHLYGIDCKKQILRQIAKHLHMTTQAVSSRKKATLAFIKLNYDIDDFV